MGWGSLFKIDLNFVNTKVLDIENKIKTLALKSELTPITDRITTLEQKSSSGTSSEDLESIRQRIGIIEQTMVELHKINQPKVPDVTAPLYDNYSVEVPKLVNSDRVYFYEDLFNKANEQLSSIYNNYINANKNTPEEMKIPESKCKQDIHDFLKEYFKEYNLKYLFYTINDFSSSILFLGFINNDRVDINNSLSYYDYNNRAAYYYYKTKAFVGNIGLFNRYVLTCMNDVLHDSSGNEDFISRLHLPKQIKLSDKEDVKNNINHITNNTVNTRYEFFEFLDREIPDSKLNDIENIKKMNDKYYAEK